MIYAYLGSCCFSETVVHCKAMPRKLEVRDPDCKTYTRGLDFHPLEFSQLQDEVPIIVICPGLSGGSFGFSRFPPFLNSVKEALNNTCGLLFPSCVLQRHKGVQVTELSS
jgi:hypothetical protein